MMSHPYSFCPWITYEERNVISGLEIEAQYSRNFAFQSPLSGHATLKRPLPQSPFSYLLSFGPFVPPEVRTFVFQGSLSLNSASPPPSRCGKPPCAPKEIMDNSIMRRPSIFLHSEWSDCHPIIRKGRFVASSSNILHPECNKAETNGKPFSRFELHPGLFVGLASMCTWNQTQVWLWLATDEGIPKLQPVRLFLLQ
jgi:hypothetical protein